jgi:ribonucleoside-diphosphate reductase alpha chain
MEERKNNINESIDILSDVVVFNKYAKYLPKLQRRETYTEIIDRYTTMMLKRYPKLDSEIRENSKFIYDKKVLPSMRALQFAGQAIEKTESRIYNCCYLPIDDYRAFSEVMFLLLGGTGVGYSVQSNHIDKLPEIRKPNKEQKYLIGDSIEGWSDAVRHLMASYFGLRNTKPKFDYSDIREKGARLVTAGGKAPGPEPLKRCLFEIEQILERKKDGEKLTDLEVHDIICHIADSVLAGGIRRAALICLFSANSEDMLTCKFGNWWETNPQRGRANNSAVLVRHKISKEFFLNLWAKIEASNSGEPGIYFTNNPDWGTNPCVEIALRPYQFCNLCEINADNIVSQEDLNDRARVASFFGTLQAGFTNFHYLRPIWQKTTEKDALIGIGITGIGSNKLEKLNLTEATNIVIEENKKLSTFIGINQAARTTCIKPSGTTSLVLGTSSGIHAWHNDYYIRRMQVNKSEALYTYFKIYHPELIKDMVLMPNSAVIEVPIKAPDNSIIRDKESALDLLERVKHFYQTWVKPGHIKGDNSHNISATVSIDKNSIYHLTPEKTFVKVASSPLKTFDEWEVVGEWMWNNRDYFNGLSVLPFDGGSYIQAPFENISKEQYEDMLKSLSHIDLTKVIEIDDNTTLANELACAGDNCEIK